MGNRKDRIEDYPDKIPLRHWYKTQEVAYILKVSLYKVRRIIDEGRIEGCIRQPDRRGTGIERWVPLKGLMAFIANNTNKGYNYKALDVEAWRKQSGTSRRRRTNGGNSGVVPSAGAHDGRDLPDSEG